MSETKSIPFTEHYRLAFPNDYVCAPELKGKDVNLTIKEVVLEDLVREKGAKDRKPVLLFHESKKKLVLNKTNCRTIAKLYGDEAKGWVGKRITVYPTKTQCGRETVDCIRIRERKPPDKQNGQQQLQEQPPREPGDEP